MAEVDLGVRGPDQARSLGGIESVGLDAQGGGGVEHGGKAAGVVSRDEQEQELRRRRQPPRAVEVDLLDLRAVRERIRQRHVSGELLRAQEAGKLEQRERIPTGALD